MIYVDTLTTEDPVSGIHRRLAGLPYNFANIKHKVPPICLATNHAFYVIIDSDMNNWFEEHGVDGSSARILLKTNSDQLSADFFVEFDDPNIAMLFKLTWGGR